MQMRTQTTPDSAETVEILSAFLVITCNINNPACLFQLVKFGESCMNGNSVQRATKNSRFNNRGLHDYITLHYMVYMSSIPPKADAAKNDPPCGWR